MAKFSLKKSLAASRADESGMQWYERATYTEVKEYMNNSIERTKGYHSKIKENFVEMGYWLKYAQENKMYEQDGYKTIWEFAQTTYNMSKSTALRLMQMNTEFSVNGNTPVLDERYKDYSKSQLQEILYLTSEQREDVSPEMTVTEIREVKNKNQPDDGMIRAFAYETLRGKIEKKNYADAKSLKDYLLNRFGKSHSGLHSNELNYSSDPKGIIFNPLSETPIDKITWSALAKRIIELYENDPLTLELPEVMDGQMEIVDVNMEVREYNSRQDSLSESKEEPQCEEFMLGMEKVVKVQGEILEPDKLEEEQNLKPYQRGCITGASPYGVCSCCGAEGVECCAACKKDCNVRCGWYQNKDTEPDERVEQAGNTEQLDNTDVDFEPFDEEVLPILSYTRGNLTDSIPFMNERDLFIFGDGHKYAALTMKLQRYIAEQINVLDLNKYRIEIRAVKINNPIQDIK